MTKEQWKDVPGFPGYQVSTLGRFKRIGVSGDVYLNGKVDRVGYRQIGLVRKGHQVWMLAHRVIASAFMDAAQLECASGSFLTVNHKDLDKLNNRLANLELVTVADNHRHWRHLTLKKMAKG